MDVEAEGQLAVLPSALNSEREFFLRGRGSSKRRADDEARDNYYKKFVSSSGNKNAIRQRNGDLSHRQRRLNFTENNILHDERMQELLNKYDGSFTMNLPVAPKMHTRYGTKHCVDGAQQDVGQHSLLGKTDKSCGSDDGFVACTAFRCPTLGCLSSLVEVVHEQDQVENRVCCLHCNYTTECIHDFVRIARDGSTQCTGNMMCRRCSGTIYCAHEYELVSPQMQVYSYNKSKKSVQDGRAKKCKHCGDLQACRHENYQLDTRSGQRICDDCGVSVAACAETDEINGAKDNADSLRRTSFQDSTAISTVVPANLAREAGRQVAGLRDKNWTSDGVLDEYIPKCKALYSNVQSCCEKFDVSDAVKRKVESLCAWYYREMPLHCRDCTKVNCEMSKIFVPKESKGKRSSAPPINPLKLLEYAAKSAGEVNLGDRCRQKVEQELERQKTQKTSTKLLNTLLEMYGIHDVNIPLCDIRYERLDNMFGPAPVALTTYVTGDLGIYELNTRLRRVLDYALHRQKKDIEEAVGKHDKIVGIKENVCAIKNLKQDVIFLRTLDGATLAASNDVMNMAAAQLVKYIIEPAKTTASQHQQFQAWVEAKRRKQGLPKPSAYLSRQLELTWAFRHCSRAFSCYADAHAELTNPYKVVADQASFSNIFVAATLALISKQPVANSP